MSDANLLSCPACAATIDTREAEPLSRVVCPACGEKVRAARTFDHFELLETLGTGGMGTVYKARDLRLDRFVALKLLRKELWSKPEYARQLQQEAKITALINHPNVVQVFTVGGDHDQFYLVMELVERGSLDDLIGEKGRLPERDVLAAGVQIASGLRAAHAKGLIHRDVKPANILFAGDGSAKITDFGLAGIAETEGKSSAEIWGTPYYVAPERLDHAPEDFRSDIFSLGATLFHALAGVPPFEGDTNSAAELRNLKNRPRALARVFPEVSKRTSETIARMMAPSPDDRFNSYDETINALENSLTKLSGRASGGRTRALIIGSALVVALLLVIVSWFFLHARPRPIVAAKNSPKSPMVSPSPAFDFEREFARGRQLLLAAKYAEARAAFARVGMEVRAKEPQFAWVKLNQALAALLGREETQMRQALQEIENAGTAGFTDRDLPHLLTETTRRTAAHSTVLVGDLPAQPQNARLFPLIFLGLTDVALGRLAEASDLLAEAVHASAKGENAWMMDYKPLAQKYLDDCRGFVAWREKKAAASGSDSAKDSLQQLRGLIAKLQKETPIATEAAMEEKLLANRVGDLEANDRAAQEKQRQELVARETPLWDSALQSFRDRVSALDFAGALAAARQPKLNEPALKQAQAKCVEVANWLVQWKETLIADLNARGYRGQIHANNLEFTGIIGATANELRLRLPYGEAPMAWDKVPAANLLAASASFAADQSRKWNCGVFAWAMGATDAAKPLLDAGMTPDKKGARKFFETAGR